MMGGVAGAGGMVVVVVVIILAGAVRTMEEMMETTIGDVYYGKPCSQWGKSISRLHPFPYLLLQQQIWNDDISSPLLIYVLHPISAIALLPTKHKNWPPVCLELLAPNSSVLNQDALDYICDRIGLWNQKVDKAKLKVVIEAVDRYYAVSSMGA